MSNNNEEIQRAARALREQERYQEQLQSTNTAGEATYGEKWDKALDKGNAQTNAQVRKKMRHWQTDSDLAGVRAKDALARLPNEERQHWERLWSDVDALLRRVNQP